MPPPIGQQGTRGGLITAMVIFAILFLTAAIFAIYFNANMRAAEVRITEIQNKYKDIIADSQINRESELGAAVAAMREQDPSLADASLKVVDVLKARGDQLSKVITGSQQPGVTAVGMADSQIRSVNAMLKGAQVEGLVLKPDGLLGSIETLARQVIERDKAMAAQSAKLKADLDASVNTVNAAKAQLEEMQKAVAAVNAEKEKIAADAAADRTAKQAQIDKINEEVKKQIDDLNAAIQAKQVEITAGLTKIADQQKKIDGLMQKMAERRMDVTEATVRRSDGEIREVSRDGHTVYINLGQGDQVSPGMTFEVYDRVTGVPALGEGMRDEDMPVGKGSIEIISVGAVQSECRIVKTTPGMTIAIGDPIANLVYDPNTKFKFVVYGKFDLDRNNVPTDSDAEVVRRLIAQWGGQVTDKINVDTDFVVLGTEPVVPNFTQEDLQQPEMVQKQAAAQAEVEAYMKVRADARELHIPIMNQNRFLYFVGYFDSAKR